MSEHLHGSSKEKAFQEAYGKLERYLEGQDHGSGSSKKAEERLNRVMYEYELHGGSSLLKTFETPYVEGYGSVVNTLNLLHTMNIDTTSQLLGLDIDHAIKHQFGFGEKTAELVRIMKEILVTRIDIAG